MQSWHQAGAGWQPACISRERRCLFMTDFGGETLTSSSAFTISIDTGKISDNAQNIGASALRIGNGEATLETAATDYAVFYEGDSSGEFYHAFMALKYRHECMQTDLNLICGNLDTNAENNTKINQSADASAGGGR